MFGSLGLWGMLALVVMVAVCVAMTGAAIFLLRDNFRAQKRITSLEAEAEKRAARKAAIDAAREAKAAEAAAKLAAMPAPLTEAEKKLARDARYAARKSRAKR